MIAIEEGALDPKTEPDCPECANGVPHEKCRVGWKDIVAAFNRERASRKAAEERAKKAEDELEKLKAMPSPEDVRVTILQRMEWVRPMTNHTNTLDGLKIVVRDTKLGPTPLTDALRECADIAERCERLAAGREGRKPDVARGWLRDVAKDLREITRRIFGDK